MQQGSSGKTFMFVVALVLILIVVWFMMKKPDDASMPNATNETTGQTQQAQVPTVNDPASQIKASGSSDAALLQDAAVIESQLDLLNSETTDASK